MTMDLVLPALVKCNATNKDCHSDPVVEEVFFISESNWRKARFLLLVVMVIVRMILTKKHLQSFLHSAKSVIMASFRRSGAVSADIVSTRLTSQYSYLCVAALQYLSPLLCFGYLALLTLQKGQLDFSICGVINHTLANIGLPESMRRRSPRPFFLDASLFPESYEGIVTNITSTAILYSNHKVFTSSFYGPVLDFLVWWCCSVWFVLSFVGFLYWRTFPDAHAMSGAIHIKKDKTTKPKQRKGKSTKQKNK